MYYYTHFTDKGAEAQINLHKVTTIARSVKISPPDSKAYVLGNHAKIIIIIIATTTHKKNQTNNEP